MLSHRGPLTKTTHRSRGISLMEVVFGLLIVGILLGVTTVSLTQSVEQEGPRGLAYSVASDLRAARAEAQRSGKMVAVCFASDGRSNSIANSAVIRKGDQRGQLSRILSYGEEYDASLFLGSWSGSSLTTGTVPDAWTVSTQDEVAIYFRADGSAFSNELLSINGNYPIVAGSGFRGTLSGPSGTLSHAKNPQTVWVSAAGAVSVEENKLPVGTLPEGESNLTVAELDLSSEPSPTSPTILGVKFYPEQISGLNTASVGQNYVNIHPNQKEGQHLEYGIATIEIKAKDSDGGPLSYILEATSSSGDEGRFTVSNLEGKMRYVFDDDRNEYVWESLISWRPPPGAPEDLEYELTVTVMDPDGNSVDVSSSAGLLPTVTSLPPARMVMCTTGKALYMANLDGSNEIHLTKDGGEVEPFFSADGSRLFSFHDVTTTERELRSRPADGSVTFEKLATFTSNKSDLFYDPTFTFAAILSPNGKGSFPWGDVRVETETDSDGNTTTNYVPFFGTGEPDLVSISIVNLMSSDPPIHVTNTAHRDELNFEWASNMRHAFSYNEAEQTGFHSPYGYGPYRIPPGFEKKTAKKRVEGFPPQVVPAPGTLSSAKGRLYNPANPNWYLTINGNDLRLLNDSQSYDQLVDTFAGGIQNDPDLSLVPKWSADGERVALVANPGANSRVVSIRVLETSGTNLTPIGTFDKTFDYQAANLENAQLSPRGKWVYFIQNQAVKRAVNGSAGNPVNISSHLGANIREYVISP